MMTSLLAGALGGAISGGATTLGAVPFLIASRTARNPWKFLTLHAAVGMMLMAAAFSVSWSAERVMSRDGAVQGAVLLLGAMGFGMAMIRGLDRFIHGSRHLSFIAAMLLHNFPEGLAGGAAMSALSGGDAQGILGVIALQNFPEGFATAVAVSALGFGPMKAFAVALASGGIELLGGMIGGVAASGSELVLPLLLAFAGGAMIYVSLQELVAEFREHGLRRGVFKPDLGIGIAAFFAINSLGALAGSG